MAAAQTPTSPPPSHPPPPPRPTKAAPPPPPPPPGFTRPAQGQGTEVRAAHLMVVGMLDLLAVEDALDDVVAGLKDGNVLVVRDG